MTDVQVVDNERESRFEVEVEGHTAVLEYHADGKRLVLIHTGVPEAVDGRGIGSALVRAAVERAHTGKLTLVPRCPFARAWLERHPDVAARVDIEWPEAPAP